MRKLSITLTCTLLATALAGCGLVYQPPAYQGNLASKETVDQLKPGMTKRQVIALMGSPAIASPFDHNRWDYVHTERGRGSKLTVNRFTLFFNNDVLVRTQGSLFQANNERMLKQAKTYEKAGVDNGKQAAHPSHGD
ncbi:MAG TPA: outer membrane protein assembly factor BamE [Rhodanobacteraceae bacterium]